MDLHSVISAGHRRRLIDLRFRPGLQLKLPALLLVITLGFCSLFLAHTHEAYGTLLAIGLEDFWLRASVQEIQRDYFVVSLCIAIAYAIVVVGVCLAGTHRVLGSIVVLRRQLEQLRKGNYTKRIQLRSGHPLSGLAEELNQLSEKLQQSMPARSIARPGPKDIRIGDQAARPVDRLLTVSYTPRDRGEQTLEPTRASLAKW
jgi:hypothetical protein